MTEQKIFRRRSRHTAFDDFLELFAQCGDQGDAHRFGHGRLEQGHLLNGDAMGARDRGKELPQRISELLRVVGVHQLPNDISGPVEEALQQVGRVPLHQEVARERFSMDRFRSDWDAALADVLGRDGAGGGSPMYEDRAAVPA